ncbi:Na+/H+ antiporter [Chitinophaga silvatica]|uniref:Na+/H+ antiporter n=1 Tax=Chitinophaga silvatica TaxID=2282649 RepID=A0A3E1YG87_9BACT|nr:Na+/H+ antiporter [Chitinophaga silvatica]RFS26382.1 Na+/H+ antiporter [Chitinophaga silvatica]
MLVSNVVHHVILVFIIVLLIMVARRLKVAYPIILVLGGLVLGFFRLMPSIQIDPELILLIFMPPLLYEAAWYTSWKDLWRWRRVISSFAFLIVILTATVVAGVSTWVIPGFTLALGFVLGGIVSPPDAVSATTIMKYVKVPRTISSIVEGESLMNDAASLIIFSFAKTAVMTGAFVWQEAAWSFLLAIVMGIGIGLVVGLAYYAVHRYLPTGPEIDVVLTLTAPYVMYIIAEACHGSGVLAVVSGGLFLSAHSQHMFSYRSRLQGASVWSALVFLLNGLVFMLIGLELPVIISSLGTSSIGEAIKYGVIITVVLIVARLLSTFGTSIFTVFISRYITTADNRPGWKGPLIIGWSGMRGVVSLAAALSIPVYMDNGQFFPQRSLILFITFTVILLTLVVQGLTLPALIRWVKLEDRDHMLPHADQEKLIQDELLEKSLLFLDKHFKREVATNRSLSQLHEDLINKRSIAMHNRNGDGDYEQYRHIYLKMLEHQRAVLHELNRHPRFDYEVITKYRALVDIEEEILRMKYDPVVEM